MPLLLAAILVLIFLSYLRHRERLAAGLTTRGWFERGRPVSSRSRLSQASRPGRQPHIPPEAIRLIVPLTHDRKIAARLLWQCRQDTGRPWAWVADKVRHDLERDRS